MNIQYQKYEGKTINQWKLLRFSKRQNKATYFEAICLGCNQLFQVRIKNVIGGYSKSCKDCGYKFRKPKSTKPDYKVLNTITWGYEPTTTN